MAMARKRDRCGDYYTPDALLMKNAGGRVNAIRLMDLKYADGMLDQQRKLYDLCPSCLYSLEQWLYGKEDRDGGNI